jgi:hypothetical protein
MARILPLLGITKLHGHIYQGVQARREQPYQCDAAKAQTSSCSHSMGCRQNGCSTCLACFLWTKQARHAAQDSKAMLSGQLAEGNYVHARRACRQVPAPLGLVEGKGRGQSWSYREFFIYVVVCGLWQRTLWGEPDKTHEYPDCRTEESALLRKSEALSESMFPQLETRLCLPASTGLLSSMPESPVSCGSRHPEARPCGPWSSR